MVMEMTNKIYRMSKRLADDFDRLPYSVWDGHVQQVFDLCGVPRMNPVPQEYFEACIDGIVESFYGGCEPEFDDEKSEMEFHLTCERIKSLQYTTKDPRHNPYKDKTIPYLTEPYLKDM